MREFFLCFVSVFVAVDAIGTLPLYLGLTQGIPETALRRILSQSVLTALAVALGFLLGGQALFRFLGITLDDFMVAGGILLFVLSIGDLLTMEKHELKVDPDTVGAVPIGVPLIAGPAVLTTLVLLAGQYGRLPAVLAAAANIVLAGLFFGASKPITRGLGKAGTRTISKIANLVMAAFAVMMVRKGLGGFLGVG